MQLLVLASRVPMPIHLPVGALLLAPSILAQCLVTAARADEMVESCPCNFGRSEALLKTDDST